MRNNGGRARGVGTAATNSIKGQPAEPAEESTSRSPLDSDGDVSRRGIETASRGNLTEDYGRAGVEAWGPEFAGAEFAGAEARVSFRHADGLRAGDGGEVRGFVLAGRDGVFHPASARVDGATVIATCPEVPEPAAVRYAWANLPSANLVNAAGLPAAPFRSDAPAGN